MKKFIKNNLLGFILGAIIFSGIGAYAEYIISADKVEYAPNISIKDKVDDLYTKVKPSYTGATSITPSTTTQTLQTNNKLLNSDITIDPIPATYKQLSSTTSVSEANLLSGITAYNSDGQLITGEASITDCISGSFTCDSNCVGSTGKTIANFKPRAFMVWFYNSGYYYDLFINSLSSTHFYSYKQDGTLIGKNLVSENYIVNNKFVAYNFGNSVLNKTIYYSVCK